MDGSGKGVEAGVGVFNARAEVAVFVRPLGERPRGYRNEGDVIVLLGAKGEIHRTTYGRLVADGSARAASIQVFELDPASDIGRVTTVAKAA